MKIVKSHNNYYYLIESKDEFEKLIGKMNKYDDFVVRNIDKYKKWSKYKGPGVYSIGSSKVGIWSYYHSLTHIPNRFLGEKLKKLFGIDETRMEDMMNKKCKKCGKGTYKETSVHDDMEGKGGPNEKIHLQV